MHLRRRRCPRRGLSSLRLSQARVCLRLYVRTGPEALDDAKKQPRGTLADAKSKYAGVKYAAANKYDQLGRCSFDVGECQRVCDASAEGSARETAAEKQRAEGRDARGKSPQEERVGDPQWARHIASRSGLMLDNESISRVCETRRYLHPE